MMKKWIVSLFMLLLTLSLACSFVQKLVPGLLKTTADDMSVKLSAGYDYTCLVISNGKVKCWGQNDAGQLGDGTTENRSVPVDATVIMEEPAAIAAGKNHTCILTATGGVKCWGDNSVGQLGDGTNEASLIPVDVKGLSGGVLALAANQLYSCAITEKKGVRCWGGNGVGQLGDGTTESRNTPVDVTGLSGGVTSLALGGTHACAVYDNGKVKCWGKNDYGQLGDGTMTDSAAPVEVKGLSGKVTALAAGWNHTCGVVDGSKVQCWGGNIWGQLGDGTTADSASPVNVVGLDGGISVIDSGDWHVCILSANGGVKCWGSNYLGQAGTGTADYTYDHPADVAGLKRSARAISAGGGHTCALFEDGSVQCWGWNAFGQLGNGSVADSETPVDVIWSPEKAADPFTVNSRTLKAVGTAGAEGTRPGEFKSPRGIAVAPDGSIYVADTFNHRIQYGDSLGNLFHIWGSFSGDAAGSADAPAGTFNEPWGIAVGPDGSVYVADTWNHRVQKFTAGGDFITTWGNAENTKPAYQLYGPRSIAVDPQGRVFVADTGNKRIMIYDRDGGFLKQLGEAGSGPGQFDEPVGIAFGSGGRLYIADTWNTRVQVFREQGGQFLYQSEWPVKGWGNVSVDNKPYLAVAPDGNVWATDPLASRVLVFDPAGGFLFSFGHYGSDDHSFPLPAGIAINADGKVFIADAGNNRIMEFSVS